MLGAALLAAACSAPSAPAAPTPRPSPTAVTADQAVAIVQAFAPTATGLHMTQTDSFSMGPSYRVESDDITATVDQATGLVTSFVDNAKMPTTSTVKLKPEEATAAAATWLASHAIDTSGLTSSIKLLDHGDTQEYQVELRGIVNGVRVPHVLDLSLDPATGTVYALLQLVRPFSPPPAPKLTLDQAVTAAKAEERDTGLTVTSSDLAVAFDDTGSQQLVYELQVTRTDTAVTFLDVDALTGAVTVTGAG